MKLIKEFNAPMKLNVPKRTKTAPMKLMYPKELEHHMLPSPSFSLFA